MNKEIEKDVFIKVIKIDTSDDCVTSTKAYDEVRMLAQEQFGLKDLNILKNEWGRPYFSNHSEIDMSISHTDGMIAVVVASGKKVGIDVEKIHKINDMIIDKYYSDLEKKILCDEKQDYETGATLIWTRKEAYSKYIGTGLTRDLIKADMIKRSDVSFFWERVDQYIVSICVGA